MAAYLCTLVERTHDPVMDFCSGSGVDQLEELMIRNILIINLIKNILIINLILIIHLKLAHTKNFYVKNMLLNFLRSQPYVFYLMCLTT